MLSYIITAISVLAFFYIIFNGREYVPGADTRFMVCACIIYISVPVWFILWWLGLGIFRERTSIPQKYVGSHKNTFKNTFRKKQASPYKTSSVNFTERILGKTKMPIYKEPENPLKRVFCYINADDFKLKKNKLCRLFDVDLREGEYVDYVALNKTNGKACYVHCIEGEGKEELYSYEISYDEVKRLALKCGSGEKYDSLNSDNWNSFITETVTEDKKDQNYLEIIDYSSQKVKDPLKEFYYEYKNTDGHRVVYLRKTNAGYRIFTASVCQDYTTLSFEDCRGEYLIRDIFFEKKDFFNYKAYDRLLSEKEAAFIQEQVRVLKGAALSPNKDFITCCQRWNKYSKSQKTKKWEAFVELLTEIAICGTSCSIESK